MAKKYSKSIIIFIVMLFVLSVSVCAATPEKTIKLKNKVYTVKVTMNAGDKLTLKVKDGKKVVTKSAKYKSLKSSVATVSKKGIIIAKKKGNTVITIKYKKKTVKLKLIVKKTIIKQETSTSTPQNDTTSDAGLKCGTETMEHGEIELRNWRIIKKTC